MHEPPVLFLDEPTSGVDPIVRREFWSHINGLVEKGVTVLVTTHFMEEAEYCDRIALIYRAREIATGSPDELKARAVAARCAGRSDARGRIHRAAAGFRPPRYRGGCVSRFSPRRFAALLVKETLQIIRDPSTLLIAFVLPLILLFLFGYAVNLDTARTRMGLVAARSQRGRDQPGRRSSSARAGSRSRTPRQRRAAEGGPGRRPACAASS